MFVQVIEAQAADAAALRQGYERWLRELGPGAAGWLGSTAGVADDATAIAVVRFESEQAARRNSDRPEQGQWWEAFSRTLKGEPRFADYPQCEMFGQGGSDEAGFVQVIRGRATDVQRVLDLGKQVSAAVRQHRPEVIGGSFAWKDDGDFTQTVYFTSEQAARQGERQPPPGAAGAAAGISGPGPRSALHRSPRPLAEQPVTPARYSSFTIRSRLAAPGSLLYRAPSGLSTLRYGSPALSTIAHPLPSRRAIASPLPTSGRGPGAWMSE